MKKKKMMIALLAALSALTLTSCLKQPDYDYNYNDGTLKLSYDESLWKEGKTRTDNGSGTLTLDSLDGESRITLYYGQDLIEDRETFIKEQKAADLRDGYEPAWDRQETEIINGKERHVYQYSLDWDHTKRYVFIDNSYGSIVIGEFLHDDTEGYKQIDRSAVLVDLPEQDNKKDGSYEYLSSARIISGVSEEKVAVLPGMETQDGQGHLSGEADGITLDISLYDNRSGTPLYVDDLVNKYMDLNQVIYEGNEEYKNIRASEITREDGIVFKTLTYTYGDEEKAGFMIVKAETISPNEILFVVVGENSAFRTKDTEKILSELMEVYGMGEEYEKEKTDIQITDPDGRMA